MTGLPDRYLFLHGGLRVEFAHRARMTGLRDRYLFLHGINGMGIMPGDAR